MCRISTLVEPPQVVPIQLKLQLGLNDSGISETCQCENLLPFDEAYFYGLKRSRPENLALPEPETSSDDSGYISEGKLFF